MDAHRHWTKPFIRALIFNFGLITTGSILSFITLVIMKEMNDVPTILAMLPFLLATVFLTLIGVFPEDTWIRIGDQSLHYFVSLGFFLTFPFAMWFIGITWLRYLGLRWFSVVSLFLQFIFGGELLEGFSHGMV